MEEDYYALLNLPRNCTDEDVRSTFKKLCVSYHPDKHTDANRQSAEKVFHRIRKAYEVLSNSQLRTIYDIYGIEGVESGWDLVLHDMNRNQIKETYERLVRQKREEEKERATNPSSQVLVRLDATGLCYSVQDVSDIFNIAINEFELSQSVDALLTPQDKATVTCTVQNQEGSGGGRMCTSLHHTISPTAWVNGSCTVGDGTMLAFKGYTSLTRYLFVTCASRVELIDSNYLSYGGNAVLGCNIDDSTSLLVDLSVNNINGVISKTWTRPRLKVNASYQIGLENQVLSLHCMRFFQIYEPDDAHVECNITYDMVDGPTLQYGAGKKLTEYSSVGAVVNIGPLSGVNLTLVLNRGNHSYTFDMKFSDIIEPVAVLYGTCLPLFVYSALQWLVVSPYLKKRKEEDNKQKRADMASQLDKAREEAEGVRILMKESFERNVNTEQCKGGLVLLQAWYGVFGASNQLIDVTIPLQCLVFNSKLVLPDQTKSGMVGFYDVSIGDDKQLSVRYRFRNIIHEVTINDAEHLRIPKQSHAVQSQHGS